MVARVRRRRGTFRTISQLTLLILLLFKFLDLVYQPPVEAVQKSGGKQTLFGPERADVADDGKRSRFSYFGHFYSVAGIATDVDMIKM